MPLEPPSGAEGESEQTRRDVALIQRIRVVPTILRILCDTTGMGFGAIGRVTACKWTACAVLDRIDFGLGAGGRLDVDLTFCRDVRASKAPVVIDEASVDPDFRESPIPRLYGFESYIAVPIVLANGEVWGTVCAIDPAPRKIRGTQVLPTLEMFAELLSAQIEVEQRLDVSASALVDATEVAQLREQFIAVLGHDLRNPVAAVLSGLSVLERGPPPDRALMVMGEMRKSCRRISGLIDDTLDFARGRLGSGIPLERRTTTELAVDLHQVVQEMQSVHADADIHTDFDLRAPVSCDPRRIGQLLSNLLANALTHGAPELPVAVTARSDPAAFRLAVRNSGRPIPGEKMARLFHPYARMNESDVQEGLGLGLFIAAEIARSHGGALDAISADEATEFTFTMPNRAPSATGDAS